MLEKLELKATRETSGVFLDAETGAFTIEGRSLPENAFAFYTPVIDWLSEYIKNPNNGTHLLLSIEYLNSGSLKQIFRIIYIMEDLMEISHEPKITWRYKKNDLLMLEKGMEFKQFLEIAIDLEEI